MLSRRTVLKSIAAAVMAPTIRLRSEVPDERLLMAFCGDNFPWYDLQKPIGVGSLTYATDGYGLIRCELPGRVEDGERRLPDLAKVWCNHWSLRQQWRPLTPEDLTPTVWKPDGLCPHCGDRRVSFGTHYPDDQTTADALPDWDVDDNTIRDVSCVECRGEKYVGPTAVQICGVEHSAWTLRRVLSLPNPMVCRSTSRNVPSILFRADGFEGISAGF